MQRIGDRASGPLPVGRGEGELAVLGQRDRGAQIGKGLAMPSRAVHAVIVMEGALVDRHPEIAEGVPVGMVMVQPVAKLDAQLEGGPAAADEFDLVGADIAQEIEDRRDRGLAHAHRRDGGGFDQRDAASTAAQHLRQQRRSRPACGSPADDADRTDRLRLAVVWAHRSRHAGYLTIESGENDGDPCGQGPPPVSGEDR